MKCVLKNKNYNTYLKYYKKIKFKHYVTDIQDATIFNKTEAKQMLLKFKHPENWDIIETNKEREKEKNE